VQLHSNRSLSSTLKLGLLKQNRILSLKLQPFFNVVYRQRKKIVGNHPQITEQEWDDWKINPVTICFNRRLEAFLNSLKQQWVSGNFTAVSSDETAQLNAVNIGKAQMVQDLLDLTFETLVEETE